MGVDFRRDHSFRIPRPDLSIKYNVPNACNDCHADKSFQWSEEYITKYYGERKKTLRSCFCRCDNSKEVQIQALLKLLRAIFILK